MKEVSMKEASVREVSQSEIFELNISEPDLSRPDISEPDISGPDPIARTRAFTFCTTQSTAVSVPSLTLQEPATPSAQPTAPSLSPPNSSTTARPSQLPAGVVLVRMQQRPWGERNSSSELANAANSPASTDASSRTPQFVDRIAWGLVIDRESQSVVIPAAMLSSRESLDILVSGSSPSATWQQVSFEVDALDSWAGWASLQPRRSLSTETQDPDSPSPTFAAAQFAPTSEIGTARSIDEAVWALPEPQHWLDQQTDETLRAAQWQDRWQGVGPKSDAALDEGDRWIDFGGMQAIQVTNQAGTGPLFDHQGACVGWLLDVLPASDELTTEPIATPESPPPTATHWAQVIDRSVIRIWDELRQSIAPRFGFLGIRPRQPRERVLARGFRGVSVYDVPPATPASQLGLAYGDLITHWNGQSVEQPATLLWLIAAQEPGSSVEVTWIRGVLTDRPETHVQSVTLSRRPLSNNPTRFRRLPPLQHAIEVDWSTAAPNFPTIADQLPEEQAVWIAAVANPSSLDASLAPGTWITTIQGVPARNPEHFWQQVAAGPDQLELQLWLPGQRETRLVKVERDALYEQPSP